jgi:hypothetical protein
MTPKEVLLRAAAGKSIQEWIEDGRESYRSIIAAIPDLPDRLIERIKADPDFATTEAAMDSGESEATVFGQLVELGKAGLSAMLRAGLLG